MLRWLPENVSSYGGDVDRLILLIFWIVGIWFLIALGTLIYFAIRYRKREEVRAAYVPAKTLAALAFVLVPTGLVLAFDLGIDAASVKVWDQIKREVPASDHVVGIRGKQFVWVMTHPGPDGALGSPDDIELENNLHVPVNTVVRFELSSEDVIHSLFIPNLRLKQDAVPGRTFQGWFEATKEGTYQIACAELCGLGHTRMRGWLHVHTPESYKQWLAEESEGME